MLVDTSDVARPPSCKTKTTYFFKTKTGQVKVKTETDFLNTIKFSHPRPQKYVPLQKK